MSITIVNDYDFKPDGDVAKGKAAAAERVSYFKANSPEAQLSLWLEDSDSRLHHYHITVIDSAEALQRLARRRNGGQAYALQAVTACGQR